MALRLPFPSPVCWLTADARVACASRGSLPFSYYFTHALALTLLLDRRRVSIHQTSLSSYPYAPLNIVLHGSAPVSRAFSNRSCFISLGRPPSHACPTCPPPLSQRRIHTRHRTRRISWRDAGETFINKHISHLAAALNLARALNTHYYLTLNVGASVCRRGLVHVAHSLLPRARGDAAGNVIAYRLHTTPRTFNTRRWRDLNTPRRSATCHRTQRLLAPAGAFSGILLRCTWIPCWLPLYHSTSAPAAPRLKPGSWISGHRRALPALPSYATDWQALRH